VENCGNTWGFDTVPQRVVVQDVSAVQTLAELGVLDSVVAKAGYFPDTYFDDETFQQVDAIPTLTDRLGEAGHLEITKERSEEHTSELQSRFDLVCRLLLEKKKGNITRTSTK